MMNITAQPSADWAGDIRTWGLIWGASSPRRYCRIPCRCASPDGHVDHQSCLDGDGMSSECPAVWTHTLSFHGAILPDHDHSRAHSCFGNRFGRFIRMACAWRGYYFRQQNHLVGDRAGVGKILVDDLAHLLHVCFWARTCRWNRKQMRTASGLKPDVGACHSLGLGLMTCLFNLHSRQKSLFREDSGVSPSVAVIGCTCWVRVPSF
jgi:hypothetical protein